MPESKHSISGITPYWSIFSINFNIISGSLTEADLGKLIDDIVKDPISGYNSKTSDLFSNSGCSLPVNDTHIAKSVQYFLIPSIIG
jgi:hypothetical protein